MRELSPELLPKFQTQAKKKKGKTLAEALRTDMAELGFLKQNALRCQENIAHTGYPGTTKKAVGNEVSH